MKDEKEYTCLELIIYTFVTWFVKAAVVYGLYHSTLINVVNMGDLTCKQSLAIVIVAQMLFKFRG